LQKLKSESAKSFNPFQMSEIQPVNDYILIEPEKAEEKTASGIFIPDTADKEKPQKAKVVAVGPGKLGKNGERVELSVKIGDTILYSKYGPTEVKLDKDEYFFIQDSDVIAVLGEEKAKKNTSGEDSSRAWDGLEAVA
jgi:chaperonin GroES